MLREVIGGNREVGGQPPTAGRRWLGTSRLKNSGWSGVGGRLGWEVGWEVKNIYKFPSLVQVPGLPAAVHVHPLGCPTAPVVLTHLSPSAQVPTAGGVLLLL